MSQTLAAVNDNLNRSFTLSPDGQIVQKVLGLGGSFGIGYQASTNGAPLGVQVNMTPTVLALANSARIEIIFTNNSTGYLYVGTSSSVGITGSLMGTVVPPYGSFIDCGQGLWKGDYYGIYSASLGVENISVWERQ